MNHLNTKSHAGIALLIFLVMMMGIGGFVLVGYTQGILKQVEASKFEHNQRVLKEAKQALLQYAYNYPQFNSEGPGRLPCPDDDNDGLTGALSLPLCQSVGRLPWAETEMNFYDARDADEERLWYAVSDSFYNLGGGPIINSDSVGSITLVDQSENIIYDGSVAGIAAIIIAPGFAIARDENNDGIYEYTQVRGTVAQQNLPENYLDTYNGFVNSTFTNDESDTDDDGFILGPIRESDPNSPAFNTIVVNDQMIVITAAEVIEVAEMAVLQAYRNSINDYLKVAGTCAGETPLGSGTIEAVCIINGGVWTSAYPWLYNYRVNTIPKLDGLYPAHNTFSNEKTAELDNQGRIPSMFGPYFSEDDVSGSIESYLTINLNAAEFMGPITYNRVVPSLGSGTYTFTNTVWYGDTTVDGPADLSELITTSDPVTELEFEDDAVAADNIAKLKGISASDLSFNPTGDTIYFWDRKGVDSVGWAKCKSRHIEDCHVDAGHILTPHTAGLGDIQILKVDITPLKVIDSAAAFPVDFKYDISNLTGPPGPLVNVTITPADADGHALITAEFPIADLVAPALFVINYEWDDNYTDGNWDVDESGTLDLSSFPGATLELSLRYYPELPDWAFDNSWHNSVMMAYADDYSPDPVGTPPCSEGTDCITINGLAGNNDNKISILTIAGEHDWDDTGNDDYFNDLDDVFDTENYNGDNLFDVRAGNDKILVVEECVVAACP